MKTKEIDVWVHEKDMMVVRFTEPMSSLYQKAKLVIELPEKKIEITESELRNAILYANTKEPSYSANERHIRITKERLGF